MIGRGSLLLKVVADSHDRPYFCRLSGSATDPPTQWSHDVTLQDRNSSRITSQKLRLRHSCCPHNDDKSVIAFIGDQQKTADHVHHHHQPPAHTPPPSPDSPPLR